VGLSAIACADQLEQLGDQISKLLRQGRVAQRRRQVRRWARVPGALRGRGGAAVLRGVSAHLLVQLPISACLGAEHHRDLVVRHGGHAWKGRPNDSRGAVESGGPVVRAPAPGAPTAPLLRARVPAARHGSHACSPASLQTCAATASTSLASICGQGRTKMGGGGSCYLVCRGGGGSQLPQQATHAMQAIAQPLTKPDLSLSNIPNAFTTMPSSLAGSLRNCRGHEGRPRRGRSRTRDSCMSGVTSDATLARGGPAPARPPPTPLRQVHRSTLRLPPARERGEPARFDPNGQCGRTPGGRTPGRGAKQPRDGA